MIVIIVCVVILAGSAFLLYRTFSSTPAAPAAISVAGSALNQPGSKDILPYGNSLDFSIIDQYNSDRKKFPYPQVSSGEVGITPPQPLIK